jgi:hypothetical protein
MDEFISIIAALVFAFVLGWWFGEIVATAKITHLLDSVKNVVQIRIERTNGMIYIYNMETNEFMAQGSTRNLVERNLKERFPDTVFTATDENLREVFSNDSV